MRRPKIDVYLDDDLVNRPTPTGWVRTTSVQETVALIKTGQVRVLSLDHDLGSQDPNETGYRVAQEIERMVANGFNPPNIRVHSGNPVGRENITRALKSIERILARRHSY